MTVAEMVKRKSASFSLEQIADFLCEDPPEAIDISDSQFAKALVDMDREMLDDMTRFLLHDHGAQNDERRSWGPPKWIADTGYDSAVDPFERSFDFLVATGCPNCGAKFELVPGATVLVCVHCGHEAAQLHYEGDREDAIGQLQMISEKRNEKDDQWVYVRGVREKFNFGAKGKEWWQVRFLPRALRLEELTRTIATLGMMTELKAPIAKEHCDVCGNDSVYFTTFQARSADEGMTVMYECTRCHNRKIFNN